MAAPAFDVVATVKGLRVAIDDDTRAIVTIETRRRANQRALKALEKITGPATSAKALRVTGGSLEDRILSATRDPQALATIVEAAKAREADVKRAVGKLLSGRRLLKIGAGPAVRYQAKL